MRVLGGYRLERELGRGGMGVVYAARSPSGEPCALKVLLDLEDEVALERFTREAHAARRLQHPHLIQVLDFGVSEGHPYLVMPLLEGFDLRERLRGGPLPIPEVVQIGAALADGLAHAHALGILHRDLKPENVVMLERGPVLTDFGLAKPLLDRQSLTQTGQLVGTPAYMAPEQARGDKSQISVATDVYGLGALLYALLVGSAPFRGPTALMILTQVMDAAPPAPSTLREGVPPGLEATLLRCLAKEPSQRFEDMVQLRDALSGGGEATLEPTSPGRGGRALLIAMALVSALFLVAVVAGLGRPAPPAASPATTSLAPTELTPTPSPSQSPPATPRAKPSASPQARPKDSGLFGREALRARLGIPTGVNAVDYAYDHVVVKLSSPRAIGLRWLDEGVERTKDPELRLAWALVLSHGLGNPAQAAPICSQVALETGQTPRLRVVRAFTCYTRADPAWVRTEMERAAAAPEAPRYAVGLHALALLREQKLDAAIAIAEEGSRQGEPGAASILASCHTRRLRRGSQEAFQEARLAYARAEELSLELFGRFPAPWASNYAHLLYQAGEHDEGRLRFMKAIEGAKWSAHPALLYVELLLNRLRGASGQRELQRALIKEIKEILLLGASRTTGVQQTRRLLHHGEVVGAPILPPLDGLSTVRLPGYERTQRAELVLEHLDFADPQIWSRALEDLNAALASGDLDPKRRERLLLGRLRVRRRVIPLRSRRANSDDDDRKEAEAIGSLGRDHDEAWAWVEFERGGAGLEAALERLERALAQNPENWPRLLALRAEIQLYLGRNGKSARDRRLLAHVANNSKLRERKRRAQLCAVYLQGVHAAIQGSDEVARKHFANLNSARPPFYRRHDSARWEALVLVRLGELRRARATGLGEHQSELGLALDVLRTQTLVKRRSDRDFAALEGLAARWPGASIFRRWALELAEK